MHCAAPEPLAGYGPEKAMNLILGIVVVFGCVLGGFAVHGGQLAALWQPSELIIIGGAAIGAMIIANPFSVTKKVAAGVPALLKGLDTRKRITSRCSRSCTNCCRSRARKA
jgi:flagellar motor component MotA